MRSILAVMLVSFITVVTLATPCFARIDPKSIIGIWMFDEGKGDVAEDSSENGFDGAIMNGAEWTDGKFGDALELDGVDDYVDLGNDERLKPQQFAVVAWFNTREVGDWGHIFQSGNNWNDIAGILIRVHQDGFLQTCMATGPGNTASWCNGPALSTEKWYHVALTFDGITLTLYLDGEKVTSAAGVKVFYDEHLVRIGAQPNPLWSWFDGFIDEVAYFNEALKQEDIQLIMNDGLETAIGVTSVEPSGKLTTTWGKLKLR